MYLSSTPLRQCQFFGVMVYPIFGARSGFLPFWKLIGSKINVRCIVFPVSVFTVCSVPLTAVWNILWKLPSSDFSLWFFSKNLKGYILSELFFVGDFFVIAFSSVFVWAKTRWLDTSPSLLRATSIGIFGLLSAETDNSNHLDRNDSPSFIKFVSSVPGFRPECYSKGVFSVLCEFWIASRLMPYFSQWDTNYFPGRLILDSLRYFIARSTAPVPVCSLGVLYSFPMFRDLQISLYSFEMNSPPLPDLIFSGSPYELKFWFKKFSTSFVSDDLQIFTVGHLLNLSTAISSWYSPFSFLLFSFPKKSICISCLARLMFLFFRFILRYLGIYSLTRCHAGYTIVCLVLNFFMDVWPPKCIVSINFFLSSVGTIIFSSLNVSPDLIDNFSNIGRYCSGAVTVWSPLFLASLTRLSSASVTGLPINVLRSSMKLNSAFFIVSLVAFLSPLILSITWLICMNCASFPSVL